MDKHASNVNKQQAKAIIANGGEAYIVYEATSYRIFADYDEAVEYAESINAPHVLDFETGDYA